MILTKHLEYCKLKGIMSYAPRTGICWNCSHQVEDKYADITSCNNCNYSFCE